MKETASLPAVILFEDGMVFHGTALGKTGTTFGEICFNTGMTGYQETFTDPSYFGQILVMTNVHMGNYGTLNEDVESDSVKISGMICRNFTSLYSRSFAKYSLQDYFIDEGIVGISDVDTRLIVKHIRDKGAMNVIISSGELDIDKLKVQLAKVPSMAGLELSSKVCVEKPELMGEEHSPLKVAVLDLGIKQNIINCLVERGCLLKVFPAKTTFDEMDKWNPDGYFLSNGPGDPAAMNYAVKTVKKILETDTPVFGICLGHQILALANGISTYKMHHGHRGINHPVINLKTGKGEITTQNHGFGIKLDDVKKNDNIEITHVNLNDQSIEGFKVKHKSAFSVQFHPESTPGPHDSRYLFDDFVNMISAHKISSEGSSKASISAN